MALADLAHRAALAIFGTPATLDLDGQIVTVRGIYQAAHQMVEIVQDAPVSSIRPVLTVRAADLPESPQEGDGVEVAGESFRVVDVQPDGFGMLKLVLQRA